MASFEFLAVVVSVLGLSVSMIYYATILANANKTRQNAILYQKFNTSLEYQIIVMEILSEHNWKTLDDIINLDNKEKAKVYLILNHYHALGLLIKEKATNPDLVLSLYSPSAILTVCRKYEAVIKEMREFTNDSTNFKGIDYLRDEVQKRYPEIKPIKSAKL
jgi:hypothetical protein